MNHYDYGFRIYNPGIAKFLSVDPLTRSYPWYTPYQFAGNKPIVAVDLDGLEEIIIHSAFWTEKFLELDLNLMTYEEILAEANRINEKGYINASSKSHARRYYESQGQVVDISPAPEGSLTLTGFTNATTGDVIKFTIYSSIEGGGFIEMSFTEVEENKGLEGELKGVQYGAAAFVMKYSGFGKLGRALHNYMEDEDPWTGEKGSTPGLVLGGITDLATMGYGGSGINVIRVKDVFKLPALQNQGLNLIQEILEQNIPGESKSIGLGREGTDLILSFQNENKIIRGIEVISNLIQGIMATQESNNKSEKGAPNDKN